MKYIRLEDINKNEELILRFHGRLYCIIRNDEILKRFQPINEYGENLCGLDKLKDESKGIENYES